MFDIISMFVLAFALEMVDSALGGGFGTILSPLLVIFGYDPKVIVPAILLSETVSGLWGGAWHARYHNVNWKVVGLTLLGSLIAMGLATFVMYEYLPPATLKYVIGILAVVMGVFIVARSYMVKRLEKIRIERHRWLITVMGFLIGYQKGTSGGNYGPFSVTGYMVMGLTAAVAIGTTTVAEGMACAIGVAFYAQTIGIALAVAIPMTLGAFLADPVAAWINNRLSKKWTAPFHGRIIGLAMTVVGLIAVLKTFGVIG